MRQSVAALALVRRRAPGGADEWLVNWNDKWQAFNLVGGHKRDGESFRDCCVREVAEELGLKVGDDFAVAPEPAAHLEYTAVSGSTRTPTAYVMELFTTELRPGAAERVAADPSCAWLTEAEIRGKRAADGRTVSATVESLLVRAGLLPERTGGTQAGRADP